MGPDAARDVEQLIENAGYKIEIVGDGIEYYIAANQGNERVISDESEPGDAALDLAYKIGVIPQEAYRQ